MPSREKARALILAGKVKVEDETVTKVGRFFPESCTPWVQLNAIPYASRGGLKLAQALSTFQISPNEKTTLDVGASTGGFTDCLLQHGAHKVFAVDVGYGQLDWKLRNDSRVVILDRQNARHLKWDQIGDRVDLAVIDVSFISLQLIIPPVLKLLKREGDLVALVKPQFEVGKGDIENKGIIKNPTKHLNVLLKLRKFIESQNWVLKNLTPSPITGQKGNREFLIQCVSSSLGNSLEENKIEDLTQPSPQKNN